MKPNCWELKKCGREPGGSRVAELGVCPAAQFIQANGVNSGRNGGRICWALAGTFCGGKVQGTFSEKQMTCMACEVFQQIKGEEGSGFRLMLPGQTYKAHG